MEVPDDVLEKLQKMTVALAERWMKMGKRGTWISQEVRING